MASAGRSPVDLREQIEIETPEHVVLRYEVAGLGSRGLAAAIDHLLLMVALIALSLLTDLLEQVGADWTGPLAIVLSSVIAWCYFTCFEGWWKGQTPGKRAMGLRVVRSDGRPADWQAVMMRNLVRAVDFLPPPYLLGVGFLFFHPRARRLGDIAADTLVVREGLVLPEAAPIPKALAPTAPSQGVLAARLTPEEFRLLEEFVARSGTLDAEALTRVALGLVQRIADKFPERATDPVTFLRRTFEEERSRRAEGRGGTAGEMAAMRLAARQAARWRAFGQIADRATRRGLDSLQAKELPDFAARYREVAADLARLRTYSAPPALVSRVERLASAGHNAFYRGADARWRRLGPLLLRECPAAVIRAKWSVLLAVALLLGSGGAGYGLLRDQPALAEELLPEVLLQRAGAAKARTAEGLTYAEVDPEARGRLAAQLMTNNIGVAAKCFAGGILAGVGSLFVLVTNGASIGATIGHFQNVDSWRYLFSFIVGHGILELFAICLAAAAGLRLGLALWAPGDRSRSEAVPLAAKLSLRLMGASATLLVVAGLIEGLLSASGASFAYRVAVSSASGVFLLLYLVNGARWASTLDGP
jgi:uncharacterized membrane protein SpoIIM required for sporulation/uncharacterized RDD family membrane protein YckC